MSRLSRRQFLTSSAGLLTAACAGPRVATVPAAEPRGFFVVGDTHFRATEEDPSVMLAASTHHTGNLVATLNRLPGTEIPETAGGGRVGPLAGVIHVGDIVDSGDKQGATYEAMQRTEWAAYLKAFGRDGTDGALRVPVMDLAGNHDSPGGGGYIAERLAERQRGRRGLKAISANGLHYSWDWAGVHFVSLGLIVGTDRSVTRRRRYGAMDSLDFLREDLAAHAASDQPLVLLHHVDVARYMVEKPGVDLTT